MSTKLSAFCDKVIEAGWLMALVIAPLFFNPYSYRSFEPDKIALLRSIALVMILAWAVKILETGREVWNLRKTKLTPDLWIFRTPLAIPALLSVGVYILTTITSIAPRISLWGSYHRLQGTYTTLSYIVIFFLTLQGLHTREQVDRLITVILVTSLPVSLYGIMQHYGLDPITWKASEEVTFRAISTMGNPIFVAAYLIMVIPLTMGRLIQLFAAVHKGGKKLILIGCYIFLLVAQLLCILFTQSRGPLLGLMGGMFFFLLLLAASTEEKKLALAAIGAAILLGLLLAALNLPNSPLESIKGVPYLGRLSGVFDVQSRTGRQRILAWEGVVNLVTADPLRTIIGYGPESLMLAFHRYFPPDLVPLMPNATFDRSHNETLDALAMTGLIGLIAYFLLFGSLFHYGLRSLGLIESPRYQRTFIILEITGVIAGALLPWLLEGKWRFAGIGISAGLIMALGIYLAIRVLLYPQERRSSEGRYSSISLIALLSAVVAHFIEIQLGIAIAAQYRTIALDDPWRRPARLILNLFVYVVIFALYLAIYGAKSRSLISATEISLVSTLLTLEMLRGTTTEISRIWLNAGVVGLLMGEVTWVFNYWAISGTEGGLLLLLLFYFLSGIAQQSLRNRLTKRVLVEYGLITLAGFVILWFYTRWIR